MSAVSAQHSEAEIQSNICENGFAIVPDVLEPEAVSRLRQLFETSSYGERNILEVPNVRQLAVSAPVRSLVSPILGDACFAVRAILFDKTAETNWNVAWHQDRVIAVQERKDSDGFRGWTAKAGVHHVQPPAKIVDDMLAIRLHLDDCGEDNGPLQVIPGSHKSGFIGDAEVEHWKAIAPCVCIVNSGDAILMRPLLLHSSFKAESPKRRRVIHIEFASRDLPNGLQWHFRVA